MTSERARQLMKLPYSEGSCFGVPLLDDGYAIGVVARATRKGKVILCYFFGPRRKALPNLSDLSGLEARKAVCALRVGDLHLLTKAWPVLGKLPEWQRQQWPMPLFLRRDLLIPRAWIVEYSDEDPNQVVSLQPAPPGITGLETDSVLGAGAAEIHLGQLLPI